MNLLSYRKNNYSQNGEDGVLEIVFQKIAKTLAGLSKASEFKRLLPRPSNRIPIAL